jgi:hypothetical protein
MEYKGYDIFVHEGWVVLGEDPTAEPVKGYMAQVRTRDPQDNADGEPVWDFPFGAHSPAGAASEAEAIEQAKALIDSGGKPSR